MGEALPIEERLKKTRFITVSSGKGGVAKTTTSAGLALSFSELGLRTLLVEQDYGNPSAHKYLGLDGTVDPEKGKGAGEILLGKTTDISQLVHPTFPHDPRLQQRFSRLQFMTCGRDEVNERSKRTDFQKGYRSLREQVEAQGYNIVILDMPAGDSPYVLDGILRSTRVVILNPDVHYNSRDGIIRLLRNSRHRGVEIASKLLKLPTSIIKELNIVLDGKMEKKERDVLLGNLYQLVTSNPEYSNLLEEFERIKRYVMEFGAYAIATNADKAKCSPGMQDLIVEASKFGLKIEELTTIPFSGTIRDAYPFYYYNPEIENWDETAEGIPSPINSIGTARDQLLKVLQMPTSEEIKQFCGAR